MSRVNVGENKGLEKDEKNHISKTDNAMLIDQNISEVNTQTKQVGMSCIHYHIV